jgi:hypothetical protein
MKHPGQPGTGGSLKYWINGILVTDLGATLNWNGSDLGVPHTWWINYRHSNVNPPHDPNFSLQDLTFYDAALTDDQASQLFTSATTTTIDPLTAFVYGGVDGAYTETYKFPDSDLSIKWEYAESDVFHYQDHTWEVRLPDSDVWEPPEAVPTRFQNQYYTYPNVANLNFLNLTPDQAWDIRADAIRRVGSNNILHQQRIIPYQDSNGTVFDYAGNYFKITYKVLI